MRKFTYGVISTPLQTYNVINCRMTIANITPAITHETCKGLVCFVRILRGKGFTAHRYKLSRRINFSSAPADFSTLHRCACPSLANLRSRLRMLTAIAFADASTPVILGSLGHGGWVQSDSTPPRSSAWMLRVVVTSQKTNRRGTDGNSDAVRFGGGNTIKNPQRSDENYSS